MKWLVIALAIALPLHADDDAIDADRPGIADGSHSMQRGRFQLELGGQFENERNSLPTLLRYGLTDSLELRVENDNGSAPFSAGFKDHFLDSGSTSMGVIGRWFVARRSYGDLRLVSDFQPNRRWDINPNLGIAMDAQHSKSATGALTVQYNFTARVNAFVDTGIQRSDVLVDAGGAWVVGNETQLDASVFREVHGRAKTIWSAGLSRRF
ncbi:MAG TPA: hypothetical protein VJ853_01770 [Thermoanaerobaculia bacterium]|nr:hypothetical protein [Thermoanaerobaculia bacterium]